MKGATKADPTYGGLWTDDMHRLCNGQLDRVRGALKAGDLDNAIRIVNALANILGQVRADRRYQEEQDLWAEHQAAVEAQEGAA